MDLDSSIRDILFDMSKELKIHKIDNDNFILEIDYEKYVKRILGVIDSTPANLE